MKTEIVPVLTALQEGMALPHALVRSMSAVSFGPIPSDIDLEELIEARFFDDKTEVRLFWSDTQLTAIKQTTEDVDELLYETFIIENPELGSEFSVCHILSTDEDGQTYISDTKLVNWKGGINNG